MVTGVQTCALPICAAIEAQVRSEAAADRADAKVDDAINNGANLIRNEVKQDADRAVSARQAAAQSESNAKASEDAAATSESNAKASETNAKQSETNAGDYAAVATTAATEAVDAMEATSEAAASIGDSVSRAAASADSASRSETNAAQYESSAATHAQSATEAATKVGTAAELDAWAQAAQEAADRVGTAEQVGTWASESSASASRAEQAEVNAKASEESAESSAIDAKASKDAASGSALEAGSYVDTVQGYSEQAGQARDEVVPLAQQVATDASATAAHREHVDGQVSAIDTAFTDSIPPYLQIDSPEGLHETYIPSNIEPVNLARYVAADGSDDTESINRAAQDAISTGRGLFLPGGMTVTVSGVANLRQVPVVRAEGTFIVDTASGGRIDVGHTSNTRGGNIIFFKRVQMLSPSHEGVALRLVGAKQSDMTLMYCDRFEVYADDSDPVGGSTAYNRITLGEIKDLLLTTVGAGSWITQTQFYGGDIRKILIDGDYAANEITFWDTCLEGAEVRINAGSRIWLRGVRGESSRGQDARVWFGARTQRCVVEDNHISNPNTTRPKFVIMEDLGADNTVVSSYDHLYERHELLSVDADSLMFNASCDVKVDNIVPGFDKLTLASWKNILDTGLIKVGEGSDVDIASGGIAYSDEANFNLSRLYLVSDSASWRIKVSAYDSNQRLLNDPGALDLGGSLAWDATEQEWNASVNRYGCRVRVSSKAVAYVRFVVNSSSAERVFSRLRLIGVTYGRSTDYLVERARRALHRPLYQESKPTSGIAPLGTSVNSQSGEWRVVGRADTTLSDSSAGGASSLSVDSTSGMLEGDVVGVLLTDGTTYWGTVVEVADTALSVTPPLPSSGADLGARVSTVRWS